VVRVLLTPRGEQVLARLSELHRDELRRMQAVLTVPTWSDAPDATGGGPPDPAASAASAPAVPTE
jgi:hypothetical protein